MASKSAKSKVALQFQGTLRDGTFYLAESGKPRAALASIRAVGIFDFIVIFNEALDEKLGAVRPLVYEYDDSAGNLGRILAHNVANLQGAFKGDSLKEGLEDAFKKAGDEAGHDIVGALAKFVEEIIEPDAVELAKYTSGLSGEACFMLRGVPAHRKPDRIGKWQTPEDIKEAGGIVV